jgi:hypothetical protein
MDKDLVMAIANAEAGAHWCDEAHLCRIATAIRKRVLDEAATLTEMKFHVSYSECAQSIRELGGQQ